MDNRRNAEREEQAARWFALRRRGVATLEERASYEAWHRDPDNAAAMAELERVWAIVGIAEGRAEARGGFATAGQSRRLGRTALVAVTCVVSLALGVLSYGGHSGFWTRLDWTAR